MLYAFVGEDAPDSIMRRQNARAGHLARLQALQAEGRLVLAGPFPAIDSDDPGASGFSGSLIVAQFDSLAAAEAWFNDDPYAKQGVFRHASIKPFKLVLPR